VCLMLSSVPTSVVSGSPSDTDCCDSIPPGRQTPSREPPTHPMRRPRLRIRTVEYTAPSRARTPTAVTTPRASRASVTSGPGVPPAPAVPRQPAFAGEAGTVPARTGPETAGSDPHDRGPTAGSDRRARQRQALTTRRAEPSSRVRWDTDSPTTTVVKTS
jgi:hypothetical protein